MAYLQKILATSPCVKFDVVNSGAFACSTITAKVSSISFLTNKETGFRFYSSTSQTYNQEVTPADSTSSDILPSSKIPSLPSIPYFGNIFSLMLHKDFDRKRLCKVYNSLNREYGPVFKLSTPGAPTVLFVSQPEDVQQMFAETASNPIRAAFFCLKFIRDNEENNFFQKKAGILSENHEEWKRVRSKVQSPILKIKNVTNYLATMDTVALDFIERIAEMRNQQGEVPENFIMEMYKWALESVATVALNKRLGCLSKNLDADSYQMKLINSVSTFFECMQNIDTFPIWKIYPTKQYKKMKESHDFIIKIADENVRIAEKSLKENGPTNSQLTVLEAYLLTEGLSRTDITTFMTDLFIAGIDTTAHTVAFTLYLLAKHPESQRTLQKQLDEVLGDGKSTITPEHLSAVSYLKCCVKEALRLYPIAIGLARTFERDTVINKYMIPAGWQGVSMHSFFSQDPSLFSQPEMFIPERWFKNRPHGPINPFANLPFSLGSRGCIGRRIAEQEMYTLLSRICHRFNVEYHYEDLDPYMHVILAPDKPLKFKFTERNL